MTEGLARQALEAVRVLGDSAQDVRAALDPTALEASIKVQIADVDAKLAARSQELVADLRDAAAAVSAAFDR